MNRDSRRRLHGARKNSLIARHRSLSRLVRPIFQLEAIEKRVLLATVSGQQFYDVDGDGVKEAGENGSAGWTVFLDANQNGAFDGTSQNIPSTNVPLAVPPSGTVGITTSNLEVSGVGTVAGLTVTIGSLTHTFDGDLILTLISPSGTRITLSNRRGSSGDNFINTIFDDDATIPITSGTAPFTGSFRPEGILSTLAGQNGDGTWKLEINDAASGDLGVLSSWSITFRSGERSTVTPANGNYTFTNVDAGTYDVRQVDRAGYNQTAPPGGFHTVVLDAATSVTGLDFGNRQPPGTISGAVFSDYNSNGTQDGSEIGLSGWTVYLDTNDSATLDGGERTTTSGAGGAYSFDNLIPGQYVVRELLQAGYVQTVPGSGGVILGVPTGPIPPVNPGNGNVPKQATGATGYTDTEIVVAFKGNFGRGALLREIQGDRALKALVNYGASRDMFSVSGTTLVEVRLAPGVDPLQAVSAFSRNGKVKWAQVNYIYGGEHREFIPNDPQYGSQYHHPLMQNNLAWDTTLGVPTVIIGDTDDGTDTEHQDLYQNIWVNQDEIPATRLANLTDINGDGYISMIELNDPVNQGPFKISDSNADSRITAVDLRANMVKDGNGDDTGAGGWTDAIDQGTNGYVDDVVGRDFWQTPSGDNDPRNNGGDTHGSHTAGIAAARTNNGVGVSGTAGGATLMPIKFYGSSGNTWTSTIVSNAYHYGTDNGAKIITTSYNVDGFNGDAIFGAAVQYMYDAGVLHFNSAGNNSQLNPVRANYDQSLYVASTESNDVKSGFSNYGWGIDIAAPGGSILSTYPNNTYQSISGTSMATPNAAGVAALIWSAHPTWTREQVAAQIIGSADNINAQNPTLIGLLGGGRVNGFKAVTQTIAPPRVKSIAGLPAEGGTTLIKPNTFTLDLASVFDPATMNLGAFELRGDGLDDVFGTGDDTFIPMTLTFGGRNFANYMIGNNRLNFAIPGPMGSDTYRLSLLPSAQDPFGQSIDGNGNGTGGDAFTRTFSIIGVTNPYRVTVDPDEVVSVVHFGNHDIRSPKVLASGFNFANPQTITVQFNEDVSGSLGLPDLDLRYTATNLPVDTSAFTFAYDPGTNTGTFAVNGILADANYTANFAAAEISDPSGNAMDADGNGVGGDDLSFNFFFLQGDANHDRNVNVNDFTILAGNFNQSPRDFTQGDFSYDGTVNTNDFTILASAFGNTLPASAEAGVTQQRIRLPNAPRVTGTTPGGSLFSGTLVGKLQAPGSRSILTVLLDDKTGRLFAV